MLGSPQSPHHPTNPPTAPIKQTGSTAQHERQRAAEEPRGCGSVPPSAVPSSGSRRPPHSSKLSQPSEASAAAGGEASSDTAAVPLPPQVAFQIHSHASTSTHRREAESWWISPRRSWVHTSFHPTDHPSLEPRSSQPHRCVRPRLGADGFPRIHQRREPEHKPRPPDAGPRRAVRHAVQQRPRRPQYGASSGGKSGVGGGGLGGVGGSGTSYLGSLATDPSACCPRSATREGKEAAGALGGRDGAVGHHHEHRQQRRRRRRRRHAPARAAGQCAGPDIDVVEVPAR